MKSIKLTLAVLMLVVAFTACTKEEFAPEQGIQKDEFVGAELVGTDLSANFVRGVETKVDAYGNWEKGDEAGMAWVVATGYAETQTEAAKPSMSNLFANHLFVKGDEGFSTYGNVYKGWHFAYYPYTYMPELGKYLRVNINPDQTEKFDVDIYKNRPYLSAMQFLTAKDNLENDRSLKDDHMTLLSAVKTIKVTVKPDASLDNDALQSLKITKVELSVENSQGRTAINPFYSGTVALGVHQLAPISRDPGTDEYNEAETIKAFYTKLPSVWGNAVASNKLETTVKADDIDLSGDQVLRFYTLPYDGDVDKNRLVFKVYTAAGYFTVKYTPTNDRYYDADVHGVNNTYIEKLAKAYEKVGDTAGYLRNWDMEKVHDSDPIRMALEFVLSADLFTEELQVIRSEKEWNEAVKVIDALDKETVSFKIGQKKSGTTWVNWAFTDEDNDGNLINLPKEAALTVTTASENGQETLILNKKDAEWPSSADFVVNTNIQVWADLHVNGIMTVGQSKTINNGATIYAGPLSTIGTKPNATNTAVFINGIDANGKGYTHNAITGTVVVDYGAYVYPQDGHKGIISYDVESTSIADIDMINKLIRTTASGTDFGYAGINTLNVKTELDINARAKYGVADEDRYGSIITEDELLANLATGITVNLQGGSLVNKLVGLNTTVAKVVAESGENTIDNVVATDVVVKSGATLNVVNTKTTLPKTYYTPKYDLSGNFIEYGSISNSGILKLNNVNLVVKDVTNNTSANIDATQGAIFYKGTYKQDGSVSGPVNSQNPTTIYTGTLDEFKVAVANIKNGQGTTVSLASNLNLVPVFDDSGNESYSAINLDGVKLNGNGFTVSTLNSVTKGIGQAVFTTNSGEIKNVVFNAPNTQYDVILTNNSAEKAVTITDCKFTSASHYTMEKSKRAIYGSGLDKITLAVYDSEFNNKGYAFNVSGAKSVTFDGCILNGWMSGNSPFTFVECTFGKSGDYQDFIPYSTAVFNECKFNNGFAISLGATVGALTFKNSCTYASNEIYAPQDVKWSMNGDGSANGNRTVIVGGKTWISRNVTESNVTNGTLKWEQQ